MYGGTRGGVTAQRIAEAFYAGRTAKASNCETDGREYKLYGNVIARRVPDEERSDHLALALQGRTNRAFLEFSFAGWTTKTTMRHLDALGVRACTVYENEYGPRGGAKRGAQLALMNGRAVDADEFYSLGQLAAMPKWHQPEPPAWASRDKFLRDVAQAARAGQQELSFA